MVCVNILTVEQRGSEREPGTERELEWASWSAGPLVKQSSTEKGEAQPDVLQFMYSSEDCWDSAGTRDTTRTHPVCIERRKGHSVTCPHLITHVQMHKLVKVRMFCCCFFPKSFWWGTGNTGWAMHRLFETCLQVGCHWPDSSNTH